MKGKHQMNTVHDVLNLTTAELVKAATSFVASMYKKAIICKDDFVYGVGTSPICIVAHMDTVRDLQVKEGESPTRHLNHANKPFNLVQNRNILKNADGVLGADDRAGVFACIDIIRRCKKEKLPMPSVILTNGEESGGKGVKVFVATDTFKKNDKGTKLFVEMDRQSCNEWVTYGSKLNDNVINYVESFGFKSAHGSYSDISDLQEEYLIPGVNLSIGYYNQHGPNEKLHIDEMYMTINRVFQMIKNPIAELYPATARYKYVYTPRSTYHGGGQYDPKKTTTTGASGSSSSVNSGIRWTDPTGRASIDHFLDHITQGGFCLDCGFDWTDCQSDCGEIAKELKINLSKEEIEFLLKNYLHKEDPIWAQLDTIVKTADPIPDYKGLKATDDAEVIDGEVDPRDPFHVGKEGEPLLLNEPKDKEGN